MEYDILIIGGGPAGICSAIYALRAGMKVLVFEKETIGGKIAFSPLIENYPGMNAIKGPELSNNLQEQVTNLGGKFVYEEVINIETVGKMKKLITKEHSYVGATIILATGTNYKTLGLPNESNLIGKGISFCAVCDGFFYRNKIVAVIGGGNTAVANAIELANVCQKVYIIQLLPNLTAEQTLIKRLQEKQNVEYYFETAVTKIVGEEKVTQIEIQKKEQTELLQVDGIFLSIGQIPQTKLAKIAGVQTNEDNYIIVDKKCMTSKEGIYAVGDCIQKEVRQLTTAVNDGTIAALHAVEYVQKMKRE